MSRLLVIFLLLPFFAFSQSSTYQRKNSNPDRQLQQYEERLVQLAFQNAKSLKVYDTDISVAENALDQSKLNLLKNVAISLNLNEGNLSPQANDNLFFPRYNLGASIKLGDVLGQKYEKKAAEYAVDISRATYENEKANLRETVLLHYKMYQVNLEVLKNRTQAVDDAQSTQSLIAQQFRSGEVSLVDYNRSQEAFNSALDGKFRAEYDLYAAKIALETLIGLPLESAIKKR